MALVIDTRDGWGLERLAENIIDSSWKRYLFEGMWLPIVIRERAIGKAPVYSAPDLPPGIDAPPEKLYRALIAWPLVVKRLCTSFSDIWATLKKGALIGFLVMMFIGIIMVWSSMTGN